MDPFGGPEKMQKMSFIQWSSHVAVQCLLGIVEICLLFFGAKQLKYNLLQQKCGWDQNWVRFAAPEMVLQI